MKEFIDSYRTANDICMNAPYEGAYLVVEGDRDYLFYSKFVNTNQCELLSVRGKPNVVEVIKLVNDRGNKNTLGIVDSDFQNLLGGSLNMDNLLESDYHDSEISIFVSPTFENILQLHCQEIKIRQLRQDCRGSIRKYFLELVKPLAYLKFANSQNELGLVFKPYSPDGDHPDFSKCYDAATMNFLGIEKLINILINYSRNKTKEKLAPYDEILNAYKNVIKTKHDLLQLCNGHDIIHLFQISLRRKLSNYDRKQYSLKDLEIQFILGYDSIHFSKTHLYTSIKQWEARKRKIILTF